MIKVDKQVDIFDMSPVVVSTTVKKVYQYDLPQNFKDEIIAGMEISSGSKIIFDKVTITVIKES